MKEYIKDKPFYDVDYCKYSDWGYRKRTRFWTNIENFEPKLCKKDCDNMERKNSGRHVYSDYIGNSRLERYRIPEKLVEDLSLNIL